MCGIVEGKSSELDKTVVSVIVTSAVPPNPLSNVKLKISSPSLPAASAVAVKVNARVLPCILNEPVRLAAFISAVVTPVIV